ncbi:hypothetical protein [Lutispora thermophila]|uniref:DUF2953 domain-containing protein n=1 Tax=Lutispora thermophila DSM 19022 TaxID=1122184 RepID=A0A1M6DS24_9FIRM|nr:hypothetical protein [Lutispora thermophila]SHI76011.1 hypothetical protein SAMN02745176_01258 [Lutispora thermophila DSM 19022]
MILIYALIIAALFFIVLLLAVPSKVIIRFDSISSNFTIQLLWLYPVLKSVAWSESDGFHLNIYLFNKRIIKKRIINRKTDLKNMNWLKKLNPTDIHIIAEYGFKDPYFTGLLFGAISTISRFFTLESLRQKPCFSSVSDFVNIDATAKLNLGSSILRLV